MHLNIEFAGCAKFCHFLVSRDAMDKHSTERRLPELPGIDQFGYEVDDPHLAHERGVEADLVYAVENLGSCPRQLVSAERVDPNEHDIATCAVINQRKHG